MEQQLNNLNFLLYSSPEPHRNPFSNEQRTSRVRGTRQNKRCGCGGRVRGTHETEDAKIEYVELHETNNARLGDAEIRGTNDVSAVTPS